MKSRFDFSLINQMELRMQFVAAKFISKYIQ